MIAEGGDVRRDEVFSIVPLRTANLIVGMLTMRQRLLLGKNICTEVRNANSRSEDCLKNADFEYYAE